MGAVPRFPLRIALPLVLAAAVAVPRATGQDGPHPDPLAGVDSAVADVLTRTGAPSASVAVVRDGEIVLARAYGTARLDASLPAKPEMRYSVGSISKQFTAAAVLLLAEEGKLSLDDRLVRWLPELTRSREVTLRQLLSMTSGYQDFWPQDYVMPMMLEPVSAALILDRWAKKPLDFEPGTKWQYSNTNYVIAGLVVERTCGLPLLDLLGRRIFAPLHMTTVTDTDQAPLGAVDPERYLRFALGPPRPAPKEGKGWLYAAGELAMTARDLAAWDVSMINRSVLQPGSYRQMETEVQLASGVGTRYGLGVRVGATDGHRLISHGGEVSGFTAQNNVYPDDRAAVAVLTNLDATTAAEQIATLVARLLLAPSDGGAAAGAGEDDLRGAAARPHRPGALHRERKCLLLRAGARGLQGQPRTARRAEGVHAAGEVAARRDDVRALSRRVREAVCPRFHVHDARRQARAVHGGSRGVTPGVPARSRSSAVCYLEKRGTRR